jgi:hypothetical protein
MSDFPKFFSHVNEKLANRVAHTPTDEVNLVARGYKQVDTKAAQKAADESANTKAEADKKEAEAKKAAGSNPRNS